MADSIDVLIVDEEQENLDLTSTFLERKSDRIATETETNPAEAVDRVAEGGFDCVVSDFRMPQLNGIELFEELQTEHPDLPFFLFTAAAGDETGEKARKAGVDGFVQKGAGTDHYDELVELIEAACD